MRPNTLESHFRNALTENPQAAKSHFDIVDPSCWKVAKKGLCDPAVMHDLGWIGPFEFSLDDKCFEAFGKADRYEDSMRIFLKDWGTEHPDIHRNLFEKIKRPCIIAFLLVGVIFVISGVDVRKQFIDSIVRICVGNMTKQIENATRILLKDNICQDANLMSIVNFVEIKECSLQYETGRTFCGEASVQFRTKSSDELLLARYELQVCIVGNTTVLEHVKMFEQDYKKLQRYRAASGSTNACD